MSEAWDVLCMVTMVAEVGDFDRGIGIAFAIADWAISENNSAMVIQNLAIIIRLRERLLIQTTSTAKKFQSGFVFCSLRLIYLNLPKLFA